MKSIKNFAVWSVIFLTGFYGSLYALHLPKLDIHVSWLAWLVGVGFILAVYGLSFFLVGFLRLRPLLAKLPNELSKRLLTAVLSIAGTAASFYLTVTLVPNGIRYNSSASLWAFIISWALANVVANVVAPSS